jgi:hypothetical protein
MKIADSRSIAGICYLLLFGPLKYNVDRKQSSISSSDFRSVKRSSEFVETELVIAERAGFYKPHPRAYDLALEKLELRFRFLVAVDEGSWRVGRRYR